MNRLDYPWIILWITLGSFVDFRVDHFGIWGEFGVDYDVDRLTPSIETCMMFTLPNNPQGHVAISPHSPPFSP